MSEEELLEQVAQALLKAETREDIRAALAPLSAEQRAELGLV